MKIEISKRGTEAFYDELAYLTVARNKIRNNPKKKVIKLSSHMRSYAILNILLIIACSLLYFLVYKSLFLIFMNGIFSLSFMLSVFVLFALDNRITAARKVEGTYTLEIDEEGICYSIHHTSYKLVWEEIEYIIFNKRTICFLPKSKYKALLAVNMIYADKVKEVLKKYNKTKLIVDNNK
jgi:hypothetical protein